MDHLQRMLRPLNAHPRLVDFAICAIGALICVALTGYFAINMALPGHLGGDHLFYITFTKSLMNGHGFRFDPQLGFPSERDNLYFPDFDLTYKIEFWIASHFTSNPFRVMHIVYIAGLLAMDGFAYWMLRRFGISTWLAVIGALATVLTPFLLSRAFGHDAVALSFSAPLALGLTLSIGLSPPDASLKRFLSDAFTITAIIVIGASGLYYAFYTVMLVAFVGVAAGLGQQRWFPVLAAACVAAPIIVLLLFSGFGLDVAPALTGAFPPPARLPDEQLFYGLNLPSLAYDFDFLPKVAAAVAQSQRAMPTAFINEGTGEWPLLPLSMVFIASPLIVAVGSYWRRWQTEAPRAYPSLIGLSAALIVFMILFGARGGLGYLFNLLVAPEIRSDARLMPFMTIAAVIIACALAEWARTLKSRPLRYLVPAFIALGLLEGIYPCIGALAKMQQRDLASASNQHLTQSMMAMLKAKDGANLKAVLQLPLSSWPEAPYIHGYDPYLHQLPYIYDKPGSQTRWSYGASDRQPGVARSNVSLSQPSSVLPRARALGFDAILIVKQAYDPAALGVLKADIAGPIAPGCRLYEDDVQVLYALGRDPGGGPC